MGIQATRFCRLNQAERTIAWLGGYRRSDKDYKKYNMYGEGWVYVANAMIIDQKLK